MDEIIPAAASQAEEELHPGLRSFAATDAVFRKLVLVGIASAAAGPNRLLDDIDADIRGNLLSS